MGSQRLSAKTMRRIERHTGLTVVRAWAHGGYNYDFVTAEHRHYVISSKTWEFEEQTNPWHYNTCSELFPWFKPIPHDQQTPGYGVKEVAKENR